VDGISCGEDGCPNAAARGGLCWAHIKRKQREAAASDPVRSYRRQHLDNIERAALLYADAENETDFLRAQDLLRKHITAYAYHLVDKAMADRKGRLAEIVHPSPDS
jgi:hypothetical protein